MNTFSDEKIFTLNDVVNHRNGWCIARLSANVRETFRTNHPGQVMALGVVASDRRKNGHQLIRVWRKNEF